MNTSFTRNKGKSSAARRHFRAETMAAFLFCALFEPRDRYARMRLEDPPMEERKRERKRISPFTCLLFCFVNFFDLFQTRLSPFIFSLRSLPDPTPTTTCHPSFISPSISVHILFSSLNTFNSFSILSLSQKKEIYFFNS